MRKDIAPIDINVNKANLPQPQKWPKVIYNPILSNKNATISKRLNQVKAGKRVALSSDMRYANRHIKLPTKVIMPRPIGRISKYTCHTVISQQFLLLA